MRSPTSHQPAAVSRRASLAALAALAFAHRAFADELPALHRAAADGDVEAIRRLLSADRSLLDARDSTGQAPLHHAAWNNRPDAVSALIAAGAVVDVRRTDGNVTPLEMASFFGFVDVATRLLAAGANPDVRIHDGIRPLHQAAAAGHTDVVRLLLGAGAGVDSERDDGRTALFAASAAGKTDTLSYLLASGADASHRVADGATPFSVAASDDIRSVLRRHLLAVADRDARAVARRLSLANLRPAVSARVVYENAFTEPPGAEWSTSALDGAWTDLKVSLTPLGNRAFLGPFGSQEVRLALGDLPAHDAVRIVFDVFVIGSWDGNGTPGYGPDIFDVSLLDGPNLLHTTFFNPGNAMRAQKLQSFPDDFPAAHAGQSGASLTNSLGLWKAPDDNTIRDAIYRLAFTVPHRSPTAVFRFAAAGLEALNNESWGLGNIRVAALSYGAPQPAVAKPIPAKPIPAKPGRARL